MSRRFVALVCGGRDYTDEAFVFKALDALHIKHGFTSIVTGACRDKDGNPRGADGLAEKWARRREIAYHGYPAPFTEMGPKGGPYRNERMDERVKPDLVVVFDGGRGTDHMASVAKMRDRLIEDLRTKSPHRSEGD